MRRNLGTFEVAMFEIRKTIKFEAAHRLINGYCGKCAHVHGHSWVVHITCRGGKLDQYGMLRDFGSFKEFRAWVDDHLDHATLVNKNDFGLLEFLKYHHQRLFLVDGNPTSENLAKVLFTKLVEMGFKDVSSVEVDETCTSKAKYEP